MEEELQNIITDLEECISILESKATKNDRRDTNDEKAYSKYKNNSSDIDKALALFMFDSIEEVTEEKLKKQRNNLIKIYHPDETGDNDVYAQKINDAYALLKKYI